MELKTLKDCYMSDVANYEQKIKEELGIKRIKKLEEEKLICSFQDERSLTYVQLCGNVVLLKEIFNITEKDLKC